MRQRGCHLKGSGISDNRKSGSPAPALHAVVHTADSGSWGSEINSAYLDPTGSIGGAFQVPFCTSSAGM